MSMNSFVARMIASTASTHESIQALHVENDKRLAEGDPFGEAVAVARQGKQVTTRLPQRSRGVRVPGHNLAVRWSGEHGSESTSTGTCSCGWSESGSGRKVVQDEYAYHLDRVWLGQRLRDFTPADIDAIDIDELPAWQANAVENERGRRELMRGWTRSSATQLTLVRGGRVHATLSHRSGDDGGWSWWLGDLAIEATANGGPAPFDQALREVMKAVNA